MNVEDKLCSTLHSYKEFHGTSQLQVVAEIQHSGEEWGLQSRPANPMTLAR